jgi:hypothetical protein
VSARTLAEQARNLPWGPTINEAESEGDALAYALAILGDTTRPASLGEVYAIKHLQWLQERLGRRSREGGENGSS